MSSVLIRRLLRPSAKGKCWLVIQQGQQKPTFWALTHAKIEECDDLPENAWPVFSLSSQDLRVLAEKPVSAQRAKSLIRQQCGQASRAINHSSFGAVYGRSLMSMPSSYAMTPATILVDAMLRERGWPKQPFVVAWLLTVENSENQILSLWSGTGRGDLTDVQATENAHDADPIVESYCASHGIEPGADNFIAFSLDEVFDAASRYADRLYAYPDFEDWHGWPIDSLWRTSAAVAAGLAVVGLANVSWHTVRGQWLERSQNSALVQEAQARQRVVDLFQKNLPAVAERSSVDHRGLVKRARELYVEGGLVTLKAMGPTHLIRVTVPIESNQVSTGDTSVTLTTPVAVLNNAYERASTGHVRVPTIVAGGGNDIVYEHAIPATNARLLAYLDR